MSTSSVKFPLCSCFPLNSFFKIIFGCAGSLLLCTGFFPVAESRGYSLVAARGPFTAVTSLTAEHGLSGMEASVAAARGLSSCGSQAYLPFGMWDLPGPGIEPVAPALQGDS